MITKILCIAGLLNGLVAWRVLMADGSTRTMTTTEVALRSRAGR